MDKVTWGIIGCGDVTEKKSGPAFNKVAHSSLLAVMRRDAEKAGDYARRHNVSKWYTNADSIINDPAINAIYIATPPDSHEAYTIAAINAGKQVYVEKPMSVDYPAALNMAYYARDKNARLVVAHYRRAQPKFKKIRQLLHEKVIGEPLLAHLQYHKLPLTPNELQTPKTAWRVNPAIAGGGLFNDLAPHQLDLMYYFFGEVDDARGLAANQAGRYEADDIVAGQILFRSGVMFNGTWCFNAAQAEEKDHCEITGTKGRLSFSVFNLEPVMVTVNGSVETYSFDELEHVQQPMIEMVVNYFLGRGPNPCSAMEGAEVMRLIDIFTKSV